MPPATAPIPAPTAAPTGPPTTAPPTAPVAAPVAAPCDCAAVEPATAIVTRVLKRKTFFMVGPFGCWIHTTKKKLKKFPMVPSTSIPKVGVSEQMFIQLSYPAAHYPKGPCLWQPYLKPIARLISQRHVYSTGRFPTDRLRPRL